MKRFKRGQTILAKICVKIVFFATSFILPVSRRKVTFASYRTEQLEGNLYFVFQELQKRDGNYTCRFLFRQYHNSFSGKLAYFFHMLKAGYYLATSRYFFIDDYYFPVYLIKPRKNTEIIQLWHAAGAFKKFGHSTLDKTFGPSDDYLRHVNIHSNYSEVAVSSAEVIPHYAEAFDMPQKQILPLGIPRTDYFFQHHEHQKAKDRFYKNYPELINKKLILYAPTFRGRSHQQRSFQFSIDTFKFRQILGEDYALLVHLHPYMKGEINLEDLESDFVYFIDEPFYIHELMVLSDVLVTDYSSVVFDFSLLERPIAFFADDLEEYMAERDFYYDYQSFIPGPFFSDSTELASWIKKGDFDAGKIKDFRVRFFDDLDGRSSQRIIDLLLNEKPTVEHYAPHQKDKLAK